jgi:hypothetical protein
MASSSSDSDRAVDLITAIQLNDRSAAAKLLSSGVPATVTDASGDTPLHHASKEFTLSKLLLDNKADVNAANAAGSTPLHKAAISGSIRVIKLLLDNNAQPLTANASGLLPEHLARDARVRDVLLGPDVRVLQIAIAREHYGRIIGPKGQALRQLEMESGATIQIPPIASQTDIVTIKGRAASVEKAKSILEEAIGIAKVLRRQQHQPITTTGARSTHRSMRASSSRSHRCRCTGILKKRPKSKAAVFVGHSRRSNTTCLLELPAKCVVRLRMSLMFASRFPPSLKIV